MTLLFLVLHSKASFPDSDACTRRKECARIEVRAVQSACSGGGGGGGARRAKSTWFGMSCYSWLMFAVWNELFCLVDAYRPE